MPENSELAPAAGVDLERRLKRLGIAPDDDGWTDRYLLCEHIIDPSIARSRPRFEAIARFIRRVHRRRWVRTTEGRERADPERLRDLSLEFLIGRALRTNIINVAADAVVERALRRDGWDLADILEQEPDAA